MFLGIGPFGMPLVGRRAAMMEFVATPMRQREGSIVIADTGQIGGKIVQTMSDDLDHLAFALNPSIDADHASAEHDPAIFFEILTPHDQIGDAGSSSIVMNITPLAEPGRCRTSTRPAASSH